MNKYPINTITVDVEALGGKITLNEFTHEYRVKTTKDQMFDTPFNGLLNAGLTEEQCLKLGETVLKALYQEVVELTYADELKQLKELKESGKYKEPTEEEIEESKKNL